MIEFKQDILNYLELRNYPRIVIASDPEPVEGERGNLVLNEIVEPVPSEARHIKRLMCWAKRGDLAPYNDGKTSFVIQGN